MIDSEITYDYEGQREKWMQIMDKHSNIKLFDKSLMTLAITNQQHLKD